MYTARIKARERAVLRRIRWTGSDLQLGAALDINGKNVTDGVGGATVDGVDIGTDALRRNGSVAMTGNLAMGSNKITGLANGTAATDAAAFGQAGAITLATQASWAALPANWRQIRGVTGSAAKVSFAAGGATIPVRASGERMDDLTWRGVGLCLEHGSVNYTATITLDTFTITEITAAENCWWGIVHSDGHPHTGAGSTAETLIYYDPDKSSGTNNWQAYKRLKRSGLTADVWSNATNITDTTPTGIKLRLEWSEANGFKSWYAIDSGGGYGAFVEIGGGSVATGYVDVNESDAAASEVSPPAWGPRNFTVYASQDGGLQSANVSARLTDLTVT